MLKKSSKSYAGFTIAELLISLAITAILLTALVVAFNAFAINYNQNERISKAVNSARQSLVRITTQIRTGLVDPNCISYDDRCTLLCSDGSNLTYQYYSSGDNENKLLLHDNDTGSDYLLCDNVTEMTFIKDLDAQTGDVESVRILMTVSVDGVTKTIPAAVVARRVLP